MKLEDLFPSIEKVIVRNKMSKQGHTPEGYLRILSLGPKQRANSREVITTIQRKIGRYRGQRGTQPVVRAALSVAIAISEQYPVSSLYFYKMAADQARSSQASIRRLGGQLKTLIDHNFALRVTDKEELRHYKELLGSHTTKNEVFRATVAAFVRLPVQQDQE